jgi:hypothetical protein
MWAKQISPYFREMFFLPRSAIVQQWNTVRLYAHFACGLQNALSECWWAGKLLTFPCIFFYPGPGRFPPKIQKMRVGGNRGPPRPRVRRRRRSLSRPNSHHSRQKEPSPAARSMVVCHGCAGGLRGGGSLATWPGPRATSSYPATHTHGTARTILLSLLCIHGKFVVHSQKDVCPFQRIPRRRRALRQCLRADDAPRELVETLGWLEERRHRVARR